MTSIAYWNERVRRFGHTGWSDPATYWYDQRLRLKLIDQIALADLHGSGRAIDFGCGVGDFCALLSRRFLEVVGYDSSGAALERARRRNRAPNIVYTNDLEAGVARPADLILAITVIQHIVDDEDLRLLLGRLVEALTPDGRIAVLETSAERETEGAHIKRRTLPKLMDVFAEAEMEPIAQHAFYHPIESPTPAYDRYRARFLVRALGSLASRKYPFADAILARLAWRDADRDGAYLEQPGSPTRLLVFARRKPTPVGGARGSREAAAR